ncbi:hypothetical protein I551_7722 [Mycobacterium ulcerans str. Harvey]|uniref:Uncharacterized protein n=1 Tax=Mycobacterium ulcerans str. Harvey TaxID=1299332 RepID=A0ABP3A4K3_MYCUL|nr:hypothetical protein I551_7722 [Mycobacterium ulcerans str. Harvey]
MFSGRSRAEEASLRFGDRHIVDARLAAAISPEGVNSHSSFP